MPRALYPILCFASPAAHALIGGDVAGVALIALRAVLKNGNGLEIAHQQITYGDHHLAFSCRVTAAGDLVIDLDIGDPRLADRIVLEADLRRQSRGRRGIAGERRR